MRFRQLTINREQLTMGKELLELTMDNGQLIIGKEVVILNVVRNLETFVEVGERFE